MALIDAHAWIGNWPYWPIPRRTSADLVALMDRHGVAAAAVCSLRGVFSDWRRGNEEVLDAAARHPGRMIPVATMGPTGGWSSREVTLLAGLGFRGLRLFPRFHSYSLTDPVVHAICEAAADAGIHVAVPTRPLMNWRFDPLPVDSIQALAGAHPRTSFLLSGPNYLVESQAAVRCLKSRPNVSLEISCLQGLDAVARMAAEVGEERVLFGTGAPLQAMACNVEKFLHAKVESSARRRIGAENALRLCGLKSLSDTRKLIRGRHG